MHINRYKYIYEKKGRRNVNKIQNKKLFCYILFSHMDIRIFIVFLFLFLFFLIKDLLYNSLSYLFLGDTITIKSSENYLVFINNIWKTKLIIVNIRIVINNNCASCRFIFTNKYPLYYCNLIHLLLFVFLFLIITN